MAIDSRPFGGVTLTGEDAKRFHEQITGSGQMTEYGRIHTDGSRSGGQPPKPDQVTLPREIGENDNTT